jgi:phosphoribosyl 1,2-cyclic phosphate phosphodiesterase
MKITFLGTGTSQGVPVIGCQCPVCQSTNPLDKRLRVSSWIEIGDKSLIIDMTPDFRYQMLRAKVPRIDAVLITHEHRDHIGGLDDIRPYNFKQEQSINIYAQQRVCDEIVQAYQYIFKKSDYPGVPQLNLVPVAENLPFSLFDNQITIQPIPVMHGQLPILGYRIGDFAYLTDVKTIPESSFELLKGLKVLVTSALHQIEHHSHATLDEAIAIAQRINAKQTYFIHMSHYMGLHSEVSRQLPANIQFAYDMLSIGL